MSVDSEIESAAVALFEGLGRPLIYESDAERREVTGFVRRDTQVEPEGLQSLAVRRRVVIELLAEDIGDVASVRRGERIRDGDDCYFVERIETDDGVVIGLLCYQQTSA